MNRENVVEPKDWNVLDTRLDQKTFSPAFLVLMAIYYVGVFFVGYAYFIDDIAIKPITDYVVFVAFIILPFLLLLIFAGEISLSAFIARQSKHRQRIIFNTVGTVVGVIAVILCFATNEYRLQVTVASIGWIAYLIRDIYKINIEDIS